MRLALEPRLGLEFELGLKFRVSVRIGFGFRFGLGHPVSRRNQWHFLLRLVPRVAQFISERLGLKNRVIKICEG